MPAAAPAGVEPAATGPTVAGSTSTGSGPEPKMRICLLPLTGPAVLTETRRQQAGRALAAAFADDSLFRWMRPRPAPDADAHLLAYFEERVRKVAAWPGSGNEAVLALREGGCAHGGEAGGEEVVGVAVWQAIGVDMGVRDEPHAQSAAPEPPSEVAPDPALDDARKTLFRKTWEVADHAVNRVLASGGSVTVDVRAGQPQADEAPVFPHIELTLMGVAPEYQGTGVGSALLGWGVRRADERGVPVVISTSDAGQQLYQKRDFSRLGVRIVYATDEEEKTYGRLNDDFLVRWPYGEPRKI